MDFAYLHFFVNDAEVWRDWFVNTLDFRPISSPTLQKFGEHAVHCDRILVLLSSPKSGRAEIQRFLQQHSEGIGEVAFRVNNLEAIAPRFQRHGHPPSIYHLPTTCGTLRWFQGSGWGSLHHTFIELADDSETAINNVWGIPTETSPSGDKRLPWTEIDHAVLNVPAGELMQAVSWYEQQFGFQRQQQFVIETPRSGLRSVVLHHPQGDATLPINEPISPNSQVQEFITHHRGAGVQHAALRTDDLVQTIAVLRARGLTFLSVPESYYQQLRERTSFWHDADDWVAIAQQQILVDWPPEDPYRRLLQTFTQPLFNQPTFFLEFIERQPYRKQTGTPLAQGFGEGNFKALFEAIEREQQQRGSLE